MEHQRSPPTHLALIYKMRLTIAFIVSNHTHRTQLPVNQLASENRNPSQYLPCFLHHLQGCAEGRRVRTAHPTRSLPSFSRPAVGLLVEVLSCFQETFFSHYVFTLSCALLIIFFLQNVPRRVLKYLLSSVLRARRVHVKKRVR